MRPAEEHFSTEKIDEQINQLKNTPNQHQSVTSQARAAHNDADTQLIHDLQSLAHNDVKLLAEIREHLAHTFEESKTIKQPIQDPQHQLAQFLERAEKKQPVKRRMVQLLSGLVAVLVIGSVLAILIANRAYISHPTPVAPSPDYYSFVDGHLIRIDAKNGVIRWKYTIKLEPNQISLGIPFILKGDTVYVVNDTTEYAINNSNGSLRWSKHYTNIASQKLPIIASDRFYVIDNTTHKVNAYTLSNGKLAQSYTIHLDNSFFTVDNNRLYIWNDATVQAIKLDNQQTLWTQPIIEKVGINSGIALGVYINDNTFYIKTLPNKQSTEQSILALNAMTGVKIGQTPLFQSPIPVFIASNGVIYYLEHDTYGPTTIHAYNVKAGKEIWQKGFNASVNALLSVDGKTVSIDLEAPNTIVTLDAKEGTLEWQYLAKTYKDQDFGIMHTRTEQGKSAIYLFTSNKTTTQIIIITPAGKAITQTYRN